MIDPAVISTAGVPNVTACSPHLRRGAPYPREVCGWIAPYDVYVLVGHVTLPWLYSLGTRVNMGCASILATSHLVTHSAFIHVVADTLKTIGITATNGTS